MVILVMEGRTRLPIRPRLARHGAFSALYRKSLLQADEGCMPGASGMNCGALPRMISNTGKGDIRMPLFVRDAEITEMTVELQGLLKVPTKTEALRQALRHELERVRATVPVRERLAKARAMADALGPSNPSFDQKAFADDLWDDL
jgi:antitoxin VapB